MLDKLIPYLSFNKAFVPLAAGLLIGWTANGWRLGETINQLHIETTQSALETQILARTKETNFNKQLLEAINAATTRETQLRREAADARHSADGLRNELTEIRRGLPELAADAARLRAGTLAELFGECTVEYRKMAEAADGLGSDRQTLMDAWPK